MHSDRTAVVRGDALRSPGPVGSLPRIATYTHTGYTVDKRARGAGEGKGADIGKGEMGLIQVQRQCRRLYDDEEHLRDRRACNFLVAHRHRTCTPLCMRVRHTHKRACIRGNGVVCAFRRATGHGCMGPICIWTRTRGDASSIISLGITPSSRGTFSRVSSEYSVCGSVAPLSERKRNTGRRKRRVLLGIAKADHPLRTHYYQPQIRMHIRRQVRRSGERKRLGKEKRKKRGGETAPTSGPVQTSRSLNWRKLLTTPPRLSSRPLFPIFMLRRKYGCGSSGMFHRLPWLS
ncbi:hypothetical protein DBV15_05759 [Temnothorax longispinosus]|uniref:Uncharacterized protein n=1 Tax=Temnothorax longispinosus TaxID=300112 RepID=A0A4S2KJZ7_9HYME|nr:hypothetical protein DBV15_05759 [Temnothorax longispinosus]